MDAQTARNAFLYTLGLDCLPTGNCPDCAAPNDAQGDHATKCTRSGNPTRAHNQLRQVVYHVAQAAGYAPEIERSPPGSTNRDRPADILLPLWNDGRPLALDVSITSPVGDTRPGQAIDSVSRSKVAKYERSCRQAGWKFLPVVADCFGALAPDARSTLNRLITQAQARHPDTPQLGASLRRAISTAIVSRAANAITNTASTYDPFVASKRFRPNDSTGTITATMPSVVSAEEGDVNMG